MKRIIAFLLLLSMFALAMADVSIKRLPAPTESLWAFLAGLPASIEAQILYALLLSGSVGMMAHYFTRWAKGEIQGSLLTYLFDSYARRTAMAVTILVGMSITAITSGVFESDSGTFVGWLNVLWFGVTNGYASDSIANKGMSSTQPVKES